MWRAFPLSLLLCILTYPALANDVRETDTTARISALQAMDIDTEAVEAATPDTDITEPIEITAAEEIPQDAVESPAEETAEESAEETTEEATEDDTYTEPLPTREKYAVAHGDFEQIPDYIKQRLDPRHVHTFSMDAGPFYYRYEEPEIDVKISGLMYGFTGKYAYRPPDDNIFNNVVLNTYRAEGTYAFSDDFTYKGSGIDKGIHNRYYDVRALVAKDYLLYDKTMVTPYFGFGHRYLYDKGNMRVTSTGALAYDRHSRYYYLPVGFDVQLPTKNRDLFSVDANLEYDIFLWGKQTSDFGSAFNGFLGTRSENVSNDQTKGFGVRGSVKFTYIEPHSKAHFYFEPFARYWRIEDSDTDDVLIFSQLRSGLEPRNDTLEVGTKFGIQF